MRRPGKSVVLVLLLAALAVFGCSRQRLATSRAGPLSALIAKAATGRRSSLQLRATGNDAGATIRPRLDLWAPFRVEATLGGYTGSGTNWGTDGSIGLSVIDASFTSNAYGAVIVKRSGSGVAVGGAVGGGTTFPAVPFNALAVDVAVAHDGTDLILEARLHGTGAFQEIGRFAQPFGGPYFVSLDVSSLRRGARVGIDDLVLVAAADPPDLSTPKLRARAAGLRALQDMLDAQRAADGDVPDAAAARRALAKARGRLDETVRELARIGKSTQKARASLLTTRRHLVSALSQLKRGVPPRRTAPAFHQMCVHFVRAAAKLP